jgi:CRP/FNR family transcriptional regulator, cyclic AMP receptor protein
METCETWYPRSFMGRLSPKAKSALLALGHTTLLDPGEVLVRQGDPGGVAYLILDGRLNITAVTENGTLALLAIRHPGDLVGEMAVVGGAQRIATVTSRGRSTLLTLPGQGLIRFLSEQPSASLALSIVTGDRLMQAQAYRIDAAAYPVEVRIARALLYQRGRMAQHSDGLFSLDLKQSELAMLIGAKEGTVQKALSQGERLKELVANRRGRVIILPLQGLARLAGLEAR